MSAVPFQVLVITDRWRAGGRLEERVRAALASGGPAVGLLLREHDLPARARLRLALRFRTWTRRFGATLLVADRVDVALAAGADGVQLGVRSLPVAEVRARWPSLLVGASCHGRAELAAAAAAGAHYATLSPVFRTASKPEATPLGVAGCARALRAARPPVFALGGVTAANAGRLSALPVAGFAAVDAVLGSDDPGEAVRELERAVPRAPLTPR